MIDAVPNEQVGAALKAAMEYFETGIAPSLDPLSNVIFSSLKPYIDESISDFKKYSEAGQRGNQKRWEKVSGGDPVPTPPDATQSHTITPYREALSTKHEALSTKHGEDVGGAEPPMRPRFSPPTVDEVRAYCTEKGYAVDADRFVDYYTSNGWRVGKNPMKDWRAAVRTWNRKERQDGPSKPKSSWTIGTVV